MCTVSVLNLTFLFILFSWPGVLVLLGVAIEVSSYL